MKKVLIIGVDPKTIDFSNPELPPGLTAEKIEKGTDASLERIRSEGYDAELFLVATGASDLRDLGERLQGNSYDGVVIGNGIRSIQGNFILFERLVNEIHAGAPSAKIIFNTSPTDTDEAIKRWL